MSVKAMLSIAFIVVCLTFCGGIVYAFVEKEPMAAAGSVLGGFFLGAAILAASSELE